MKCCLVTRDLGRAVVAYFEVIYRYLLLETEKILISCTVAEIQGGHVQNTCQEFIASANLPNKVGQGS
jgi:hypothetical protein